MLLPTLFFSYDIHMMLISFLFPIIPSVLFSIPILVTATVPSSILLSPEPPISIVCNDSSCVYTSMKRGWDYIVKSVTFRKSLIEGQWDHVNLTSLSDLTLSSDSWCSRSGSSMRVNKDGQRLLLDGTVIVAVDRSRGSRQGLHKGLCCAQCWNREKGGVSHWRWWVLGPPASHPSVLATMKPSYLPRVSWYSEFSRSGFLHLRLHSQCIPTLEMTDLNVLWIYYNILHKVRYTCFCYRWGNHLRNPMC